MSLDAESSFLRSIEQEALKGQIIPYKQIKDKLESEIQKRVSDDYIWDLFNRHGWNKKAPHQSHPKSDKEEQEGYKKLPKLLAAKTIEFKNQEDTRPIKLFFKTRLVLVE